MSLINSSQDILPLTYTGYIQDTVTVFADAVTRLLQHDNCSAETPAEARQCITGRKLLRAMKNTKINGSTGWLQFDENGDRRGIYVIKQMIPNTSNNSQYPFDGEVVATFNSMTNETQVRRQLIWANNRHNSSDLLGAVPNSKCSYPCRPHESRVVQDVKCCWVCSPCRVNEYVTVNSSRCVACPEFTWPDSSVDYKLCVEIQPTTLQLNSATGCFLLIVACGCLFICLMVLCIFHRYRDVRVIKASSRELSLLMLVGIGMGYLAMICLMLTPSEGLCRFNFFIFCTSFTLIYVPLLVRAMRIFRIFDASTRSVQIPGLTEMRHQLLFSAIFFMIQVSL